MNATNLVFSELKKETFNLSNAVKMAKVQFTKQLIETCIKSANNQLSKSNQLDVKKTVNEIYSVFQLSNDNLIKICRFYSMQLDGVFCKRVILQREFFDDPTKKVSNLDKYTDKTLLKGTLLKKKGFKGKDLFTSYPDEYKDKVLKTFVKTDKDLTTYGYVKNDRFNLYFVLDVIRDYIKAGKPDIETLKSE